MGIYRGRVTDVLLIPVSVSAPLPGRGASEAPGHSGAQELIASLMLDTGAKYCSLTPEIIQQLGLPFLRNARVSTHMGEGAANLYVASFAFPASSLASLSRTIIAGLGMPTHLVLCDGVIGRNVLRSWETFYSGLRQRLTIRDYRSLSGWLFS